MFSIPWSGSNKVDYLVKDKEAWNWETRNMSK